jgi:hypothetical protein
VLHPWKKLVSWLVLLSGSGLTQTNVQPTGAHPRRRAHPDFVVRAVAATRLTDRQFGMPRRACEPPHRLSRPTGPASARAAYVASIALLS